MVAPSLRRTMALDPTSSTAYESVPLHDSGNPRYKSKTKLSQQFRKPLRALEGFPFISKGNLPPTLRIITFLLLETSFLALGIFCFLKPIPLPVSNDDIILREAKAATTAIGIVWHTVAGLIAQDLTICVFSAECMAQYRLTGKLRPGETDRVSAIHTGLFSRMKHFVSPTATPRYRVAFAAAISLMVLGPIGPSVLNVVSISVQTLEEIQLTKLTMRGALHPITRQYDEDLISEKAAFALRVETRENGTFGFETVDERVLIPWPQLDLRSNQEGTIMYWTDVVTYDYECSWNAPVLNKPKFTMNDSLTQTMEAGGIPWQVRSGGSMPSRFPSQCLLIGTRVIIMPLVNAAYLNTSFPALDSSISGFIFIWPSAFLPISSSDAKNLTISPTNYTNTRADGLTEIVACDPVAPRASILLCDPRLQTLPGEVRLEGGKLHLSRLANDSSLIGNIPDYAANGMVTQALVSAMEPTPYVSDDAAALFSGAGDFPSLKEINHNMNTYLQIAAKAYLSGAFADLRPSRRSMVQNGTKIQQKPALVSSKPFLLALTVIIASLAVLLLSLHVMVRRYHDMQLFDLQNFTIREKPCLTSESQHPIGTSPTEMS